MSIEIPEQVMPAALAEAVELLSAAERYEDDLSSAAIQAAGAASDALGVLLDVSPRYAPARTDTAAQPLSVIEPSIRQALDRASAEATTAEEILRIARAVRALDEA